MIFALVTLLILHTPDGHEVHINPEQVTSLYAQRHKGHITEDANCLVNLADGKFVAVHETCEYIEKNLEQMK